MAKIITMNYHTDSGHGWLLVPVARLAEAGLTAADISRYSYIHPQGGTVALEEDCDMSTFLTAYDEAGGKPVRLKTSYRENSRIRNWPSFGTKSFSF